MSKLGKIVQPFSVSVLWLILKTILTEGDDPLQNINWKSEITKSYRKPWMAYADSFVKTSGLMKCIPLKQLLSVLQCLSANINVTRMIHTDDIMDKQFFGSLEKYQYGDYFPPFETKIYNISLSLIHI